MKFLLRALHKNDEAHSVSIAFIPNDDSDKVITLRYVDVNGKIYLANNVIVPIQLYETNVKILSYPRANK